ncbi:MAG: aldehyde dehydrogenase EutE [bacterium]|nr:aldehyde dehydrogenase EutE [bacterium]
MSNLTDQQVTQIVNQLAVKMQGGNVAVSTTGGGVFETVDQAVAAATAAYKQLGSLPLKIRDAIINAIRESMRNNAELLAQMAIDETGLGRYEHKVQKNLLVTNKTEGTEALKPSAASGDRGLTLVEYAPYGVIGSITPVTNPTSTIICNSIGMIAAGNAVVFNVHPGAKDCSMATIRLINQASIDAGGPANIVTAVGAPTIESAGELMHHSGIRLLVVTGGAGVVKAAMQSGKRAICAGPGNPPVVVDETADLEVAAHGIVDGASFDNNIICVDEKEVFVVDSVADELIRLMKTFGAYQPDVSDQRKIESTIFDDDHMNKDMIGKDANYILSASGVNGPDCKLIILDVPADHPLVAAEQMMPVLPIVRVPNCDKAIELALDAEHGFGHSAGMYSRNIDALSKMARAINASIFVKNGCHIAGLGAGGEGFSSFTIASPTGEGLTGPISFSRERRCIMVDHFRIV